MSDKPDKVIENTPGTLFYDKQLEMWCIGHYDWETHLTDFYLVEMPDRNFPYENGKEVLVSGFCYLIPNQILADKRIYYLPGTDFENLLREGDIINCPPIWERPSMTSSKNFAYLRTNSLLASSVATPSFSNRYYNIKVTGLKYDYRGFTIAGLQYVPRIEIPMESLPEWLVEKIHYFEAEHHKSPFGHTDCKLIAKGEWNEQIVYIISNYVNVFFDIYNEVGDIIDFLNPTFDSYDNLSTSKNWEVIYECGPYIHYPIIIGW